VFFESGESYLRSASGETFSFTISVTKSEVPSLFPNLPILYGVSGCSSC
jgi:hypothetical protein